MKSERVVVGGHFEVVTGSVLVVVRYMRGGGIRMLVLGGLFSGHQVFG